MLLELDASHDRSSKVDLDFEREVNHLLVAQKVAHKLGSELMILKYDSLAEEKRIEVR